MITVTNGESTKDVKYEIKKVDFIQTTRTGLNKITISPKTKDGKYEKVTLNIWGDKLEGLKVHSWETGQKGDFIVIRAIKSVELQEYQGKSYLVLTLPANGYSLIYANDEEEDETPSKGATDEFLPF